METPKTSAGAATERVMKIVDGLRGPMIVSDYNKIYSTVLNETTALEDTNNAPYMELIYAVARKFDGETRHETALRYIREAEARATSGGPVQEAKKP